MPNPKLLHELDWTEPPLTDGLRIADVCGYEIFEEDGSKYHIFPRRASTPRWRGLDPITAQAVLIHIQQSPLEPRRQR